MNTLQEVIDKSKELLLLEENWDGYDAFTISKDALERACKLLKVLNVHIMTNFKSIMDTPSIDPCADGSVDLFWHDKNYQLLINVNHSIDKLATYYGKFGGVAVKGVVDFQGIENLVKLLSKKGKR